MDIKKYTKCRAFLCLRRGVSHGPGLSEIRPDFSLPTQRCFPEVSKDFLRIQLFSAYAEVFPAGVKKGDTIEPFLCLRRGVSIVAPFPAGTDYFSLPTQRCFHHSLSYSIRSHLFSAYAEVFLGLLLRGRTPGTFLCLRRGVSKKPEDLSPGSFFSLPTQRCFHNTDTTI